jgi:hypothetical protein
MSDKVKLAIFLAIGAAIAVLLALGMVGVQ